MKAEVSFLLCTYRVNDNELYRKEFSTFLNLIKQVAFKELQFRRLYSETFDIRPFHIKILEENGFKEEGRLKEHVLIRGKYYDSLLHGIIHK